MKFYHVKYKQAWGGFYAVTVTNPDSTQDKKLIKTKTELRKLKKKYHEKNVDYARRAGLPLHHWL